MIHTSEARNEKHADEIFKSAEKKMEKYRGASGQERIAAELAMGREMLKNCESLSGLQGSSSPDMSSDRGVTKTQAENFHNETIRKCIDGYDAVAEVNPSFRKTANQVRKVYAVAIDLKKKGN